MLQNRRTATGAGLLSMAATLMVAAGCAMTGNPQSPRCDFNICHYIFPYTRPPRPPAAVDPCTYGYRPTRWHHWPTDWDSCVPGTARMAVDVETIPAGVPVVGDELQPLPRQSTIEPRQSTNEPRQSTIEPRQSTIETVPPADALPHAPAERSEVEKDKPAGADADTKKLPNLPTPFEDDDEPQEAGEEIEVLEIPPIKLEKQPAAEPADLPPDLPLDLPASEGDTRSSTKSSVILVAASQGERERLACRPAVCRDELFADVHSAEWAAEDFQPDLRALGDMISFSSKRPRPVADKRQHDDVDEANDEEASRAVEKPSRLGFMQGLLEKLPQAEWLFR